MARRVFATRSPGTSKVSTGIAVALLATFGLTAPPRASADSYDDAMSWLNHQQEVAQGFTVHIDQGADPNSQDLVAGHVDDVDQLDGPRVSVPWVSFEGPHDSSYVGPVGGSSGNVDRPSDYRVAVYSQTDALYLQGTYPLHADGSWDSGDEVAHGGRKVAELVRSSDGSVVAVSGEGHNKIGGVEIRVFSSTDVDYLQATVPLYADGSWTTRGPAGPGTRIARLVRTSTGRTINSSEWASNTHYEGLVRSFWVPQDDPDYGFEGQGPTPPGDQSSPGYRIEQRSWIYDDALAALAFTKDGETERAASILQMLQYLQNPDGSLPFSLDVYRGRIAENYIRSGALAWVGEAAVEYDRVTNSDRFQPLARGIADCLLSLQVSGANGYSRDDPRYNSILGGRGWYDSSYLYHDQPVDWVSTEHNVDAYFFLRDLGKETGSERYLDAAAQVRDGLLTNLWNSDQHRFNQGVSPSGPDLGQALDLGTWGGLFLNAIGEKRKARQSLDFARSFHLDGKAISQSSDPESYNQTYSSPGPISGFQPYLSGPEYPFAPATAWPEGTWGAILLKKRLGYNIHDDVASMERLQNADPRGGFVQVTEGRRSLPYEFHVWPAVAGTAWGALVEDHSGSLWRADPQVDLATKFMPNLYFDSSEKWRPLDVNRFLAEEDHRACDQDGCHPINSPDDLKRFDSQRAYLDVAGDLGDSASYHSPNPDCASNGLRDCNSPPASKIYYHKHFPSDSDPYAYLDYWIFYRFNDAPDVAQNFEDLKHEGDWESVTLGIADPSSDTFDFAAFSQHGSWYSYLRSALSCDGGTECGPTSQHLNVFVANRSHANYPRTCSAVEAPIPGGGQLNCGKDDPNTVVPEAGGYDGAKPWGGNLDPSAVEEFPTDSYQWQFWPGKWGPDAGSPDSPGNQSHYTHPGSSSCPSDNHAPASYCGGGGNDKAASSAHASKAPGSCGNWFGHDVVVLACNPRLLSQALRHGDLGRPGRMGTSVRPALNAGSAPGLLQITGPPLQAGQRVAVRRVPAGTQLFVRVRRGSRTVAERFQRLGPGTTRLVNVIPHRLGSSVSLRLGDSELMPSRMRNVVR
jgi:hypothetical protein